MIKKSFDQKIKRTKKLHKAIKINLKRRTIIVDDKLVHYKDVPVPSWIELSIIDVCNRSCSFCPKADPKVDPNTYQKNIAEIRVEKHRNGPTGFVKLTFVPHCTRFEDYFPQVYDGVGEY